MHGMIHLQFQRFVETHHGAAVWRDLNRRAGLEARVLSPFESYPDEEIQRLFSAAAVQTGVTEGELLEAFGRFLIPAYLNVYASLLKPAWRTLELLENTENTIHRVVRARQPGAAPPELRVERVSPKEVLVTYGSSRRLCALARGMIAAAGAHYREALSISERTCMLRGADACRIAVRLKSSP